MLKTCSEDFVFYLTTTNYLDYVCYLVIVGSVIFGIFCYKKNNFKLNTIQKWFISILLIIILILLSLILIVILNSDSYQECTTAYNDKHSHKNNVNNDKVIIVGDSRMEYIVDDESIELPSNFEFIAKSGMTITWLKDTALEELYEIIDNKEEEYKYHVLFNMGVNDLSSDIKDTQRADEYFDIYKEISEKYKDINIYLLSINPIDENIINDNFSTNKRTTEKIENFNQELIDNILKEKLDNVYYCDSYNNMSFETPDGLHYNKETNIKIIDYIANKCLKQ